MGSYRSDFYAKRGSPQNRPSRSMHDTVLEAIGRGIVRGDFPAGSLLPPKDELLARLDVSHTTLREALQTLTEKGMLAAKAKVGTRVLADHHWNMFDAEILAWRLDHGIEPPLLAALFEIRQTLEPMAAALTALRASDEQIVRLTALAQALATVPDDREAIISTDIAFHRLILEGSGNPFLRTAGAVIETALTVAFMMSAPTAPDACESVRRQHLAVAEAVAARDPQRASDATRDVIRTGSDICLGAGTVSIATIDVLTFAAQGLREVVQAS